MACNALDKPLYGAAWFATFFGVGRGYAARNRGHCPMTAPIVIAMPLALDRSPRDIAAAFRECVIGVWSGLDDALPEILV